MTLKGLRFLELRFHTIIKSNHQLVMSILTCKKGQRQVSILSVAHERASSKFGHSSLESILDCVTLLNLPS